MSPVPHRPAHLARPTRSRRRRRVLGALGTTGLVAAGAVVVGVATSGQAVAEVGEGYSLTPIGSIAFAAPVTPPSTSPTPPAGPGTPAENLAFVLLNQQRATNGLGPLTWSANLANAATAHNRAMAAANVLSHQLPGEADLGARITASGYVWRAAAENIGWTSQTADTGATQIQSMFYNETPPNDGHRRNILSTATTQVGIDVFVSGGKLWVTEDFGAPR